MLEMPKKFFCPHCKTDHFVLMTDDDYSDAIQVQGPAITNKYGKLMYACDICAGRVEATPRVAPTH